jgi:hypothetical protein
MRLPPILENGNCWRRSSGTSRLLPSTDGLAFHRRPPTRRTTSKGGQARFGRRASAVAGKVPYRPKVTPSSDSEHSSKLLRSSLGSFGASWPRPVPDPKVERTKKFDVPIQADVAFMFTYSSHPLTSERNQPFACAWTLARTLSPGITGIPRAAVTPMPDDRSLTLANSLLVRNPTRGPGS